MLVEFRVPASSRFLSAAMEGLTAVNCELLRRFKFPKLYDSGVYYKREQRGLGRRKIEQWQNFAQLLQTGSGDCEDLACALAAEKRVYDGVPARAVAKRSGPKKFHAIVQLPDGEIEDPSRVLGMGRR